MIWTQLYRRADRIVALWPGGERSIRELFGIDADRVQVIPNARDEQEFRPATIAERREARDRLIVAPDAPLVAVIGSLSEEKQVDRAIDAIAQLTKAMLVIAGDGPLRAELEELAQTRRSRPRPFSRQRR